MRPSCSSRESDQALKEFEEIYKQNPSDRTARTRLIAAYQSVGRATEVEKIWQEALKKNSHDTEALLQRSQYYLRTGKLAEAQTDLNAVLHFQPDSAEAHYLLSKIHARHGDALNERQELAEAVRNKPDFLQARVNLAKLLIATNSAPSALRVLEETPPLQQNTLGVVEYRSWAQLATGDRAGARKGIDRALATARTRNMLLLDATCRLTDKDDAGARKSAEEVLMKNPEDTAALHLLVQSYKREHHRNAAVQAVRHYADTKPTSAILHHFLGQLLLEAGARSEARQEFQTVKSSHPTFLPAVLDLAQMDIADGKWDEAAKSLSAIAESHWANLQVQLLMGAVEEYRKNFAEAVGHYRKALEFDERNMMALNNLAYILLEYANQPDEAYKFAAKAGEVAPDNPAVQDTLGWVFYRKGLYADAVKYLERAESKQPDSTTKLHLGSAYVKSGDRPRGVRMLQSAMATDPKIAQSKTFQEVMSANR